MAVELRNWLEGELQVDLPIVELMRSPSVSGLAELLAERLETGGKALSSEVGRNGTANGPANGHNGHVRLPLEAAPTELLARIDDLSGDQVDALLAALLDENRPRVMVGNVMTIAPQSLAGLSLAEKRRLLAQLLQEKAEQSAAVFPLSHGQRGLWFLHQMDPRSSAYNVCYPSRIRSPLDLSAFRRAVQKLIDRHPGLRTTFEERDGELLQRVHEQPPLPLEVIDASSWSEDDVAPAAGGGGPSPVRPGARAAGAHAPVPRAPDDHIFLLSVHHIVGDFWSLVLVIEEMQALYPAECDGRTGGACRRRPSSTATSSAGRPSCWPAPRASGSGSTGSGSSPARRRCSTCRPTGRARPSSRGAAVPSPGGSSRTWCAGSRRWRRPRGPRSTRCCWPRSRCCSAGTPARRISWSAARSPAGAGPDSRT